MWKTLRCYGPCVAYTDSSENTSCKVNTEDPLPASTDREESTQPHCLGSAMYPQTSSGSSFVRESVSSGVRKTNVPLQEERPLSFVEGTLTSFPVCVMLLGSIVPKSACKYVYFI